MRRDRVRLIRDRRAPDDIDYGAYTALRPATWAVQIDAFLLVSGIHRKAERGERNCRTSCNGRTAAIVSYISLASLPQQCCGRDGLCGVRLFRAVFHRTCLAVVWRRASRSKKWLA